MHFQRGLLLKEQFFSFKRWIPLRFKEGKNEDGRVATVEKITIRLKR